MKEGEIDDQPRLLPCHARARHHHDNQVNLRRRRRFRAACFEVRNLFCILIFNFYLSNHDHESYLIDELYATYFFHPLILFIRQRNNMKIPTLPIQLVAARVARGVHRVVHVGPGTDAVDTPGRAISRQESRFDSTSKTNKPYLMTIQDLSLKH